jgi:ribosomal protein L7/L12
MPTCPICDHGNPLGVDLCQRCGAPLAKSEAPATDEILALLAQGRKIEAIRVYREQTGVGLKEAKDAVEALERGESIQAREFHDTLTQELLSLLGRGEKIEAIKLYRDRTGTGLKEAKEAVEALGARHGVIVKGAGCAGMVLLIVVGVVLPWLLH